MAFFPYSRFRYLLVYLRPESSRYLMVALYTLFNGLLPKSFFAGSKTFFDKSKARSRRFQNSPFGLKQLESLFFHFAKIF
jgi:hypothetical protein